LRQITKSGGLWYRKRDEKETWALAPFVVGMWEMNVDKIDEEFKEIHQEYGRSAKIDAPIRRGDTRQMRVIPIRETLIPEHRVAQYDEIAALVEKAGKSIGVMECVCRKYKRMEGHTCEYTDRHNCCTTFMDFAEQLIDQGVARRMGRNEALAMFDEFRALGMVLMPSATEEPTFVCSCCKDCCMAVAGLRHSQKPAEAALSNYYSSVSAEDCTGCGECEEYCPMDAISIESGTAEVNRDRCIGCGVCVSRCETGAITLQPKEKSVKLPMDRDYMYKLFNALREK
jgi:ferredoxin